MTFIQLALAFWSVHLVTFGAIAHVHRVIRAKICPNRSELRSSTRCTPMKKEKGFPVGITDARISVEFSLFLSFSPPPLSPSSPYLSLFIYLTRCPVDVSNGNFFPSRKKRSAVYLKRRDFIAHSRGNDTLSNNHLARIPWSLAIVRRRFRKQWNFWRTAKGPEETLASTSEKSE